MVHLFYFARGFGTFFCPSFFWLSFSILSFVAATCLVFLHKPERYAWAEAADSKQHTVGWLFLWTHAHTPIFDTFEILQTQFCLHTLFLLLQKKNLLLRLSLVTCRSYA